MQVPTPEATHASVPLQRSTTNLRIVSEEDAPAEVAALYAHFRSRFHREQVPGILQCFATHPPLLEQMIALAEAMLFCEGALRREEKELLATFVSARNRCAYCADSHGFALRAQGGSEEALEAALSCNAASPALSPRQQTWLSFVARLSDASHSIAPEDIAGLRHEGWTDLQIAETIHLTALFAAFNRVVNGFGLSSPGPARLAVRGYNGGPDHERTRDRCAHLFARG